MADSTMNLYTNDEHSSRIQNIMFKIDFFNTSDLEDETPEKYYKVTRKNCGYALVINQKNFKDKRITTRHGTDEDCRKLKATFELRGYKVIIENDLNRKDILKAVKNVVDKSGSKESLIVCILSHGSNGSIISADSLEVSIQIIQDIMANDKLIAKPKMLIIQACQGGKEMPFVKNAATDSIQSDGVSKTYQSAHADFLIAYSTITGYVSFRVPESGTWYIQELCKVIDDHGDNRHMQELLTKVNRKVAKKTTKSKTGQTPEHRATLRMEFYLPERID